MSNRILAVVVLALLSGCSPDQPDVVAVAPEPLAPAPEFDPGARVVQQELDGIRDHPGTPSQVEFQRDGSQAVSEELSRPPLRLVFECADGVMFAVRMLRNGLVLYPPRYPPASFLTLPQVPSASGVHYRAGDIDFRSKGDLATLEMGRERFVDCVANPAAAVWEESPPRITTPR